MFPFGNPGALKFVCAFVAEPLCPEWETTTQFELDVSTLSLGDSPVMLPDNPARGLCLLSSMQEFSL